mmetsp:Transcript_36174/g.84724  ORF Transcript_36174/g.84724 Transcript_36174/m.84724 type:complete len:204 (+) Transcript_36174:104-715(+)
MSWFFSLEVTLLQTRTMAQSSGVRVRTATSASQGTMLKGAFNRMSPKDRVVCSQSKSLKEPVVFFSLYLSLRPTFKVPPKSRTLPPAAFTRLYSSFLDGTWSCERATTLWPCSNKARLSPHHARKILASPAQPGTVRALLLSKPCASNAKTADVPSVQWPSDATFIKSRSAARQAPRRESRRSSTSCTPLSAATPLVWLSSEL